MIVLSGPSASGKTEVAKLLMNEYGIKRVITTTTRPMRKGEVDGVDYYFVSKERFKEMINEGLFVEYTEYNGNLYGSLKSEIADNKVIAIEPNGMRAYIALNDPHIIVFYLDVCEKVRRERMLMRGDLPENVEQRLIEDKVRFGKDNIPEVDVIVDSQNYNQDEVTKYIFNKYRKILDQREAN
ncbi:MAG: hypothetical protein E7181_00310 [Erysipelotrichaceae bacterium]|nr:hypothetical protein [Erysipelotrichaceae bacterium]